MPNCSKVGCATSDVSEFYEYCHNGKYFYSGMCKEHQKEYHRDRYRKHAVHKQAPAEAKQKWADPRSGWNKRCSYKEPEQHELHALLPARSFRLEANGRLHGYCFDCQALYSCTYRQEEHTAPRRRDPAHDPILEAINFYGAVDYAIRHGGGTTKDQIMYGIAQLELDGPIPSDLYQRLWDALDAQNLLLHTKN